MATCLLGPTVVHDISRRKWLKKSLRICAQSFFTQTAVPRQCSTFNVQRPCPAHASSSFTSCHTERASPRVLLFQHQRRPQVRWLIQGRSSMRWSRADDTAVERARVCCIVNVDERARGQASGGVSSVRRRHMEKRVKEVIMSTQRGSIRRPRHWACSSSGKRA